MRIATLTMLLGALAVVACGASSRSPDPDGGSPSVHDDGAADGTASDAPVDSSADSGLDTARDKSVESTGPNLDALADSFFPFPETALPPEGIAGCMIFSPATGGGCVCSLSKGGHLYQVNCVGNAGPCTCAIDNTPTKTVPNDICGSAAFVKECGFP